MEEIEKDGCSVLLTNMSDGRYTRYFNELARAVSMLSSWARTYSGGALSASFHVDYLIGLKATLSILESRFMFETNDSLVVDLFRSGYPHSYMFARISADRVETLSAHLKGESLTATQLKQIFLDDLFATGTVNRALLNRIACARYAEIVVGIGGVFDPRFMCGKLESDSASKKRYRLQWSIYDQVLNIPILCGMTFEYSGIDLTRSLERLKLVLKYETRAGVSIATLAHAIDSGIEDIRPLALSRATLGPLHLPGLTVDTELLSPLPGALLGEDIVIEITIDHTHAVSSVKPSALAVKFGVRPEELQVYAIRTQNPLCYERGADAVERIVILPHRMLQNMSEKNRNGSAGFMLVPYIKEGEIQ